MPSTIALRSVMTTDVVTVTPDLTLAEAADVLAEHGIGAAPVVDASGQVVGLLRDEDLLSTEARLHVPTTIAILGVNFTLPGDVARYDEELRKAIASDGQRGDGEGVPAARAGRDARGRGHADARGRRHPRGGRRGRPRRRASSPRGDLVRHLARST